MKRIGLSVFLVLLLHLGGFAQTGGWLIIPPEQERRIPRPTAGMFALEVKSAQINTTINGQAATTSVDQVFFNPTRHQLQGYYFFPIPQDATIDKFSMYINGKETQGEILDADKAKKIYEDIVRQSLDPALLEFYNQGLLRVRIFPIQPQSDQRVKLTYTQALDKDNGTVAYQFPIGSRKDKTQKMPELSFKVTIESQEKIKNIYSPTHEVEVIRKGEKEATVGFEASAVNTQSNFKLYYRTDKSKLGMSVLSYNESQNEDGYFFMNISPGFAENQEIVAKDITFVLDASGSMAGEKMEQAKKALQFCISNLNEKDRFNIVRFSTEASTLYDQVKPANKANIKEAEGYIDGLRPIGGTNIEEALDLALDSKTKEGRPYFIVFMTDGKPTIGETDEAALLKLVGNKNTDNTRIFTFGIGTELNTHLLDKLTDMTKAYRTYVLPDEDIEIKVSDFYTKVASPILTDIEIKFDEKTKVTQVQPKQLPDLFKGGTITLMGRYKKAGKATILVKGKLNGKIEAFEYEVNFEEKNTKNEYIASLWAARTVGYLLDQIRLQGESKEVIDEVVRLSKKHGIITPYTSYLILEDEAISLRNRTITPQDQLIRSRVTQDAEFIEERDIAYDDMKKTSGKESVKASKEAQDLNQATNISAPATTDVALDYKDKMGESKNLAEDIQNLNGRAFYKNDNIWVDSYVQLKNTNNKSRRIKFNSKEYFELLNDEPESRTYLALGKNVRFVMNNKLIEVYE